VGSFQIIDVSNPAAPQLRGSYDTPGDALGVYVTGGLAYVADGWSGLQIIGVSNPTAPTLRGSCDTPGYADGVYVTGGLAYVADGGSGLLIIDVSNPTAPTLRGSYGTPGYTCGVYVTGGLAYVVGGLWYGGAYESGLLIIDVSNPSAPQLRGSYDTLPGNARGVYVTGGLTYVADGESGLLCILEYGGGPPRLQTATISDVNNNGLTDAGDQLVLTLDRSVVVTTSVLRASHFFLPVAGDSLGRVGFRVGVNPVNSQQIVLTLGQGVRLTRAGTFSMQNRASGSPSGIDFATSLPVVAIRSLDGISAVDGGATDVDDSGVDIEFSLMGRSGNVGPSGGIVSVIPSPDAAYRQHRLTLPAKALATTTTFTLRPPARSLGVIGAVQIQSSNPAVTFASPATVRVEYREGDIDRERGKIESEMKVHQLVENPAGVFKYLLVPGAQTLNMKARQVSVGVSNLNPRGSLPGTIGVFAGIPIETVDERTITIKPGTGASPVKEASPALAPGPLGAYTLHKVEFPGYVTALGTEANRRIVTLRAATYVERYAQSGGCSFPAQSGAIFSVSVKDALGQPVAFNSPVRLTVQFKARPEPDQTDVVHLDSRAGLAAHMRLAYDRLAGSDVDFALATAPLQTLNLSQGTVTVDNFVGLAGADGGGTFGVVAGEWSTPAAHWYHYR
jgi:hypothetical protein